MASHLHLEWTAERPCARFRGGVSLHSHTLHSREHLGFIYQAAARLPLLAAVIRNGENRYREIHGTGLDLSRGWWTPPLGAHDAWSLEKSQIEDKGLDAFVSLTDHDDIEAPMSLQILNECGGIPISVEWTVPFRETFFHLGVHNLPASEARVLAAEFEAYRLDPREIRLPEILAAIASHSETLIVFNHPLWDEKGIGAPKHRDLAGLFLRLYGSNIHALELNGLRPWRENREAIAFADRFRKPVISGGDRHVFEPNAVINLTNASNFDEFADEIRSGWSDVLILNHYREAHALRIMHNMMDVLRTYDLHANGWRLWSDRVFYCCDDGQVRSLTELFGDGTPAPIRVFVHALQFVSAPHVRRWLKGAFFPGEEVVL